MLWKILEDARVQQATSTRKPQAAVYCNLPEDLHHAKAFESARYCEAWLLVVRHAEKILSDAWPKNSAMLPGRGDAKPLTAWILQAQKWSRSMQQMTAWGFVACNVLSKYGDECIDSLQWPHSFSYLL